MAKMVTVKCENCPTVFEARIADRKRGWGKFCSKSCKAIKQERRTGQYKRSMDRQDSLDKPYEPHSFSSEALGQWDD